MLQVKDLTKVYTAKKKSTVTALKHISIAFEDRGLVFILGKSGSGKSTLLNLLGGIDVATSGEIIVAGRSTATFSESDYDSYRNTYVGFVFQEYNLIESDTVSANIALALELQGKQADRTLVEELLRRVELVEEDGETFYERQVNELSGGQKQRVAVARALIKNPQIILADEPTGALDSGTSEQLYELLKSLSKDKLILVVTHDRENAERYGDRIIELKDGEIIEDTLREKFEAAPAVHTERADATECRLLRSKLPFRRSFRMGASGLLHKPLRLVISIVLSVVAFMIFGFSVTVSMTDKYTAELKTLYANQQNIVALQGQYYGPDGTLHSGTDLTQIQLNFIREYSGREEPIVVFTPWRYTDALYIANYLNVEDPAYVYNLNNPYVDLGVYMFNHFAELDPETGEEDINLTPDERFLDPSLCRLPQTVDEIAITDLRADMFLRYGYRSEEDGTVAIIRTPDDLIGKRLGEFTICGVYTTEQKKDYFEQYDIDGYGMSYGNPLKGWVNGARDSLLCYGFVCKGYLESKESTELQCVLLKLSGNFDKDMALLQTLNYEDETSEYQYSVVLYSIYSNFVSQAEFIENYLVLPATIGAVIFTVFAALLLTNFLNVSIEFKQKEIGILRALGARKRDVLSVCLSESFCIAGMDFFLSLIALIALCMALNAYFCLSIFNMGILQIGALFLLSFGVAALATIFPIVKITRKKPIDIIYQK